MLMGQEHLVVDRKERSREEPKRQRQKDDAPNGAVDEHEKTWLDKRKGEGLQKQSKKENGCQGGRLCSPNSQNGRGEGGRGTTNQRHRSPSCEL